MSDKQEGQALLAIILVMVVVLTVGLSVATRSITNLRTVNDEASSQRAFSAAEAGIEQSLKSNTGASGTFSANSASFNTTYRVLQGAELLLNSGNIVARDEGADLWLSDYPSYTNTWSGRIDISWGTSSDSCQRDPLANTMAALEIVVISGSKAAPVTSHYVFDPCPDRASYNHFTSVTSGSSVVAGKTFAYKVSIGTVTSGLIARIVPLYANTMIAVEGFDASGLPKQFPPQGAAIDSVGSAGGTERKITIVKSYPSVPSELFPFIIFSPK